MRRPLLLSATLVGLSFALLGCLKDGEDGQPGAKGDPGVASTNGIELRFLGRYQHKDSAGAAVFDAGAAEIPAYDPLSKRLVVVNAAQGAVDVLNATDPTTLTLIQTVDVGALVETARSLAANTLGAVNSVSIRGGVAAVAIEATVKTDPGYVAFIDCATLALRGSAPVGALPDMVTFTADGKYVLTADEGEPSNNYAANPAGTVSIINVSGGFSAPTVTTASFTAWDAAGTRVGEVAGLTAAGLRFNTVTGAVATFSQDMEPEYITVSADSKTAYVTLQENNSIAVIDITTATVTSILPLGFKDHGITGNELDVSDRDLDGSTGQINIRTWPGVVGAFMPDTIASYQVGGQTYLVTANEGDGRDYGNATFEDEITVANLVVAQGALTGRLVGQDSNDKLGRLTVLKDLSTTSRLVAFGARSFTIWSTSGTRIWDSGSEIERQIANRFPANFNANSTANALDNRSDNKGPEPEGVAIGTIGQQTYAFIGLERIGGVMVYDITNPQAPRYVSYRNDRNFNQTPGAGTGGDLAPEGVQFISAANSPTGKDLLVVGNETSGTTVVYRVADLLAADG